MRSQIKQGLNILLILALVASVFVFNMDLVQAEETENPGRENLVAGAAADLKELKNEAGAEVKADGDKNENNTPVAKLKEKATLEPIQNNDKSSAEDQLEISDPVKPESQTGTFTVPAGQFYFEIMPDFFLNAGEVQAEHKLFASSREVIGKRRSGQTFGGAIMSPEVRAAWKAVAFHVYDENGNLLETSTGTLGDEDNHGRWGGVKHIGPFPKGKKYTIKIDQTSTPAGYHSWFSEESGGNKFANNANTLKIEYYTDVEAVYDPSFTGDYAETRFHMDIVNIAFVGNKEVAKDLFTLDDSGNVMGLNPKYVEGKDYILEAVDQNSNLPKAPTGEKAETLAPEGHKPVEFEFMGQIRDRTTRQWQQKLIKYNDLGWAPEYNYFRRIGGDEINTFKKYKTSSTLVVTLKTVIPQVIFDWNYDGAADPVTQEVYYKKSLANNFVAANDDNLPKSFPKAPVRPGWVLASWNTAPDGSGQVFDLNTIVSGDMVLYAQWKDSCTVKFDANGGTGTMADKVHKFADNPYILPKCGFTAPQGKVFAGWEIDGKTYKEGDKLDLDKDVLVKALWKDKATGQVAGPKPSLKKGQGSAKKTLPNTSTVR